MNLRVFSFPQALIRSRDIDGFNLLHFRDKSKLIADLSGESLTRECSSYLLTTCHDLFYYGESHREYYRPRVEDVPRLVAELTVIVTIDLEPS